MSWADSWQALLPQDPHFLSELELRAWQKVILLTGLRARAEPWGYQRCPDIVGPNFKDGHDLHLDVSATHPCLQSISTVEAREPGSAAARRESPYKDCPGVFTPLALEHWEWIPSYS